MFDKDGNFLNWWSTESKLNFVKRSECFENQYSSEQDVQTNNFVSGFFSTSVITLVFVAEWKGHVGRKHC